MSTHNKDEKWWLKAILSEEDQQDSGEGGEGDGGSTGEVRFAWDVGTVRRDDQLPAHEIKRLLDVHKDLHKAYTDKQKITREDRKALKEGRLQSYQAGKSVGYGAGKYSPYKTHPISMKAQFSGIDKQVIGIPSLNEANTNDDLRNDLENRLQNRLSLQNQPKFNPKPRPY